MARLGLNTKRVQIDKANSVVVISVAIASALLIFTLVGSKAMLSTRAYQSKVISKKEKAKKQLKENLEATEKLEVAYQEFIGRPKNILEGNPKGTGPLDGDNAKLTLDSMPSKYDFPALTTSLEKLAVQNNFTIEDISGTDDEVGQKSKNENPEPELVEMPFEVSISGSYMPLESFVKALEKSIRPIQPQLIIITAANQNGTDVVNLEYQGKTYYLPEKNVSIKEEIVR